MENSEKYCAPVGVYEIAVSMIKSGLSPSFVANAVELALYYEGVYDLMVMWYEEEGTIEDIQKLIDEKITYRAKTLYDSTAMHFNENGRVLSKEIEDALRPILEKWISDGFHPGEIKGFPGAITPLITAGATMRKWVKDHKE
jgi:hypothetical protein